MVELKFKAQRQNIQAIKDVHNKSECEEIALKSYKGRFVSKFKSMLSHREMKLSNFEKRYEPVWYLKGESNLEYKRKADFNFNLKPEVKFVKINKEVREVHGNRCTFVGEEHCFENDEKSLFIDADSGNDIKFEGYIDKPSKKIKQTEELMKAKTVVIPAKIKASFLIRQLLKELIKPFHADKVIKEEVSISKLVLYFHPVYTFEFEDSKGDKIALDVDAVTGEVQKSKGIIGKGIGEIFEEGDLFEIGTEFVTDFIPGVKASVMLVQKIKAGRKRKAEIAKRK